MLIAPRTVPPVRRHEPANERASLTITKLTSEWRRHWEVFVGSRADATLFHSIGWHDAVRGAFGHEPVYLLAVREGRAVDLIEPGPRIAGVLPLFLVTSRLGGRMLVSSPYGVAGGVLSVDDASRDALFCAAKEFAEKNGVRFIDLRNRQAQLPELPTNDRYVTFERELPARLENVMDWLPRKARAAARNGRDKYGLSLAYGEEHLPEVWQLYTRSMRRLASIAYPIRFFQELMSAFPDRTWVSLVRWRGQPVAGLVTFLFRDRVMPYFFGCTRQARRCSAANFVYLKTMERAVAAGFRIFDFGRSRRDNIGSVDFKRFHGFEPKPLGYQYCVPDGGSAPDLSPESARFRFARKVWPYLPLRLTQLAGGLISRHVPG